MAVSMSFTGKFILSSWYGHADLIRQINEMGEKAKAKAENSWHPEPPLAA